ncbi:MAG: S8 family serine peptidase [Bdellovibrionales bacterium]
MKHVKIKILLASLIVILSGISIVNANGPDSLWYFNNQGASVPVDLEDLKTIEFPAVVGEDLRLRNLPATPKKEIIVAVVDTGVQVDHPELAPYIATKPTECEALKAHLACLKEAKLDKPKIIQCEKTTGVVDTDKNGYPLDCNGFNFTAKEGDGTRGSFNVQDQAGHGTHIAGIISASGAGGVTKGLATGFVKILPVKVIGSGQTPTGPMGTLEQTSDGLPLDSELSKQRGFVTAISRGIVYAIRSGAKVINISIGWPAIIDPNQKTIREILDYAQKNGVMIVSAAGNDSANQPILPCAYAQVICVASYGPDGAVSHFSNFGSLADIAAPGFSILSTYPTTIRPKKYYIRYGYEYKNGTSMAAPFVAGALAMMLSQEISPQEAFARLILGAREPRASQFQTWQNKTLLSGNLDMEKSFQLTPQALIYPVKQEDIRLLWDRKNPFVMGQVLLKNLWLDGKNISFRASRTSDGTELQVSTEKIDLWPKGVQKTILFRYPVNESQSGEDQLKLDVLSDGKVISTYKLQLQIMVPTLALLQPEQKGVSVFQIQGVSLQEGEEYRSIDGSTDFLLVKKLENRKWSYRLLRRDMNVYRVVTEETLGVGESVKEGDFESTLIKVEQRDLNRDGIADLVFFFTVSSGGTDSFNGTEIHYRDRFLKPLVAFGDKSYVLLDQKITALPDQYSWVLLKGFERIFFKGMGEIPPLDMPRPTPRDPNPDKKRTFHIYYLAEEGLRVIPDPKDTLALTTFDDLVLYLKGSSFENFYYVTQKITDLIEGKKNEVKIGLSQFRLLEGLTAPDLFTQNPSVKSFAGPALPGQQKITFIHTRNSDILSEDFVLSPINKLDSLLKIIGAKYETQQKEVFALSQYDLVYKNLITGKTYALSANRFSFLPSLLYEGFFFPLEVDGKLAAYAPSYNLNGAVEVIVAGENGLVKPAQSRIYVSNGCKEQNFRRATDTTPAQAVFICNDKIVELDLQ